jgi:hypothetical protein
MGDYWSQSSFVSAGNASVTQAAPAADSVVRVRALQLSGGAGAQIQVLDGAAVIWAVKISGVFSAVGLDIRSSAGATLTVAFRGSSGSDTAINVQGDYCAADSGYGVE